MKRLRELVAGMGPTGWLICLALAVVAFVGLGLMRPTFLGLQFDPFGMDARKIDALTTERDAEASNGVARGLEVEGMADQQTRLDATHRIIVDVNAATASAVADARNAPDAATPLDADRLARLRANDQRLCDRFPSSCRAAAPPDPG